ncbi:MAG: hypothetical protein GX246_02360 [Clostridiales bacterium]|nr:hypothetical protein [Bacillota bacterium]NLL53975.1 hypothetical protein [Clostridiales bacterium]
MTGKRVELRLPATRDMMLVVRLTTAGILARSGLTVEAVEDAKMAVEEACGSLIRASRCAALYLCFVREPRGISLTVQAESGSDAQCTPVQCLDEDEADMLRAVLLSLMDEVSLVTSEGCLRSVRMHKVLP